MASPLRLLISEGGPDLGSAWHDAGADAAFSAVSATTSPTNLPLQISSQVDTQLTGGDPQTEPSPTAGVFRLNGGQIQITAGTVTRAALSIGLSVYRSGTIVGGGPAFGWIGGIVGTPAFTALTPVVLPSLNTLVSGGGSTVTYGSNTVTVAGRTFTTNAFQGMSLQAGGYTATIASNTGTVITLSTSWTPAPAAGTAFTVSNVGSGASVTYGASTVTDTTKAYPTNILAGMTVNAGSATGVVASNTATAITLVAPWSAIPAAGTAFSVVINTALQTPSQYGSYLLLQPGDLIVQTVVTSTGAITLPAGLVQLQVT